MCRADLEGFLKHAVANDAAISPKIQLLRCIHPYFRTSMSSIKRNVKKKTPPRPEPRFFLEIQPTVVFREKFGLLSILVSFSADVYDCVGFEMATSEQVLEAHHEFYPM